MRGYLLLVFDGFRILMSRRWVGKGIVRVRNESISLWVEVEMINLNRCLIKEFKINYYIFRSIYKLISFQFK